jgi:hypothetical protein
MAPVILIHMQIPAWQGPICVVLEFTNQTANVSAHSDIYEEMADVPIVTAATAYDDPDTGTTFLIVIG